MNDSVNIVKKITSHAYGTWNKQKAWKSPKHIVDAQGVYFYDAHGKAYLDFTSQFMCSNLGHKNRALIEALVKQAEKMPYIAPAFVTDTTYEAIEALNSVLPFGMEKLFFSTSGTEANEAALKISRQFQEPLYKIISRYHAFHGATPGSLTLTGDHRRWLAEKARNTVPGVLFAPDCYCYRCPFSLEYPDCNIQCARYLEYMIKEEGNVAAMILEPIPGANGRLVPPPEYFPLIRKICDENNILLIADEVMTGWFRTGTAFAVNHWGIVPDILTMAKGATSAYTPCGITATTSDIADYFEDNLFNHGHTYAYHPLVLSVIPAAVSEYKKLNESGLINEVSKYLKESLYNLADKHECIGDVRGMGHFWGLELVKNRKTKKPFNIKSDVYAAEGPMMTAKIAGECMQNGLWIMSWYDALMISPPLIINKEQIAEGIHVLDKALSLADEEVESTDLAVSKSSEFRS